MWFGPALLADRKLGRLQEKVDQDLAEKTRQSPCPRCGAKLHCDNYPRKPRGGPQQWDKRLSFTCAKERHRVTPPSVRFLGRKVYVAVVVVLVSAMLHGLSARRVEVLRQRLGIDRRTLEHWRAWWQQSFAQGAFWKAARGQFASPPSEQRLPLSLCEAFDLHRRLQQGERRDRLLCLLGFLSAPNPWLPA